MKTNKRQAHRAAQILALLPSNSEFGCARAPAYALKRAFLMRHGGFPKCNEPGIGEKPAMENTIWSRTRKPRHREWWKRCGLFITLVVFYQCVLRFGVATTFLVFFPHFGAVIFVVVPKLHLRICQAPCGHATIAQRSFEERFRCFQWLVFGQFHAYCIFGNRHAP